MQKILPSLLRLVAAALLLARVPVARSIFLNDPSELSARTSFDFVVVGSGPGGATVASRLSENKQFNVLLIEAGPNDEGVLDIQVPAFQNAIPKTYEWNTSTIPIPSLDGRVIEFRRGHVLGGSSSVNGLVYTRGSAEDYNTWAKISGDNGWRWDKLQKYIKKNERFTPPNSGRNITGEFNPAVHGFSGAVSVSLGNDEPYLLDRLGLESVDLHEEFNFNLDMNSGNPIGLGWLQATVGNGERSSAATGYLNSTVRARPNLTILVNTYVTRVLSDGKGSKKICKVEIGNRATRSVLRTIEAKNEVILAAGVIGTPQILLNSGIGDSKELKSLNISVLQDIPDVGKNFVDHVGAGVSYIPATNGTPSIDPAAALQEWLSSRTGPFTERGVNSHQILFSRAPSNSSIWIEHGDPSSGPNTPHFELLPVDLNLPGFVVLGGLMVLVQPSSSGKVGISSSNPFDEPVFNPAYLETKLDRDLIMEGIRTTKRFFAGPGWAEVLGDPQFADPDVLPREQWETITKMSVFSGIHGVGTASMSSKSSRNGVVGPDLKVKSLQGLRIVDASVIPHIPSGHTQAPTYILAERASDLISDDWCRRN
ncbi:aryl-alcohol oxidase [Coprinopsis marcescibilis]|uniref:pyranose dehydrogenase (acceptor) n=1 Tax=Coprinopsis marcescibilis TaxID=230819 RepID=A0A5C3KR55_COPMA|nr:aryl-alcohol oxidase [Coprinopsis marcescibilis]